MGDCFWCLFIFWAGCCQARGIVVVAGAQGMHEGAAGVEVVDDLGWFLVGLIELPKDGPCPVAVKNMG